ncbi:MAG: HAD family hydrolase [Tannerellaceae bacterium]|jgi:putative hydrolase of the HAD superfamily|nr:HAD family hydrolase [Tannerellaceae bacterium]
MTLIRSNPLFRLKRAELIADICGLPHSDAERIQAVVIERDKIFDRYNEISGRKAPAKYMYRIILEKIKGEAVTAATVDYLFEESNSLFAKHPPLLLHADIPAILAELRSEGISLNIGSNTGFAEGPVMRETLKAMGIGQYFSFFVFSDEIGASKPSAAFFEHISCMAGISKAEIMHVGDNPKADYEGARRNGFRALLIAANYTMSDLQKSLLYA